MQNERDAMGEVMILKQAQLLTGLAASACFSATCSAITLQEHGVTFNQTGLIDHVTQLQWLDANLTYGTAAELASYFGAGWRVADEDEFLYLLGRGASGSALDGAEFLALADRLGFVADPFGFDEVQPWLCEGGGGDSGLCDDVEGYGFVSFALEVFPGGSATEFNYYHYLATYQLYNLNQSEPCPHCMGQALLVRPVPAPAAAALLFCSIATLLVAARSPSKMWCRS